MRPNQLNRLKTVQLRCPKVRNLCVSFTFGKFPFLIFSSRHFLPSSLCSIKNWVTMGGWAKKTENFCDKIILAGCKWSCLNAPRSETPVSHSLLETSFFQFSAPASGQKIPKFCGHHICGSPLTCLTEGKDHKRESY